MSKQTEYYIMDLPVRGDCILWWRPNSSGYTGYLESAGRYSHEEVTANMSKYNNGYKTRAIPCDVVEKHSYRSVPNEPNLPQKLRKNALVMKPGKFVLRKITSKKDIQKVFNSMLDKGPDVY